MRNPGGRVEFEHKRFGVTVDDQTGQAVILTVDEAIAIRFLFSERRADGIGGFYFFMAILLNCFRHYRYVMRFQKEPIVDQLTYHLRCWGK